MTLRKIVEYDVIIFDCDGVLIDSNMLKCRAFGKSVEEYPNDIVDGFVDHCKKNFGISRYVKFEEFFKYFANEPFDEKKYHLFLKRYGKLCEDLYSAADFTPGVENLLYLLRKLNKKLYVASGSDEVELNEVLKKRDLHRYFQAIYGSPKQKAECVSVILKKNPGLKAVFIGDALSDLNAAQKHGLDFIYMSEYSVQKKEQDEHCRRKAKLVINTLEELL